MDERDLNKFSWSGLFLVTACCTFLFSLAIKLMDGEFSTWLLIIAAATSVLGVLSWTMSRIDRQYARKRDNSDFTS